MHYAIQLSCACSLVRGQFTNYVIRVRCVSDQQKHYYESYMGKCSVKGLPKNNNKQVSVKNTVKMHNVIFERLFLKFSLGLICKNITFCRELKFLVPKGFFYLKLYLFCYYIGFFLSKVAIIVDYGFCKSKMRWQYIT